LPNLNKGLTKAGRKRKDFTLLTGTFIASGATRDEVEKAKGAVKQQVSFYASTRTYKGVLDAHGWGETCFRLSAKAAKGDWAGMPAEITDEMLDELAIVGTYDEISKKLAARYKGILDRVVVGLGSPERQDSGRTREFVQEIQQRMAA
jgi:alkanesulfonate monooxygenase SsuD/methylene tetrahydromethanopterin reductase-like flavin-dependent oxidoreductase (luciferase family)